MQQRVGAERVRSAPGSGSFLLSCLSVTRAEVTRSQCTERGRVVDVGSTRDQARRARAGLHPAEARFFAAIMNHDGE